MNIKLRFNSNSMIRQEIEESERVMGEEIEVDDEGLEEIIANVLIEQLTGGGESEVRRRPYNSIGPDCDELRNMLAIAVRQEKQARELRKVSMHLFLLINVPKICLM